MVCPNCGKEIDNDSVFCAECGSAVNAQPAPETQAAPVYAQPAAQPTPVYAQPAPAASKAQAVIAQGVETVKKNPILGILLGAVALIVVLAIVLVILLNVTGGYKSAINNLIDVTCYVKADKLDKLAPAAYWEYYEDEYDESLKDLKEALKDNADDIIDEYEDEYGKGFKVSYKITDEDKLDKDEVKDIAEILHDAYNISKKSVKAGYEVDIEVTIKGPEDDDEQDDTLTIIQIDNSWYVVSTDGENYCRFIITV